jgi:hypothetical protein
VGAFELQARNALPYVEEKLQRQFFGFFTKLSEFPDLRQLAVYFRSVCHERHLADAFPSELAETISSEQGSYGCKSEFFFHLGAKNQEATEVFFLI